MADHMTDLGYNKHKDCLPQDTVRRICGILAELGLETDLTWTSHQFDRTCSNHVTIRGTSMGTNGKGTDEDYATASGYAELMERLQNRVVGKRTHVEQTFASFGFYEHPDERLTHASDIARREDPVINGWLEGWGCRDEGDKQSLLEELGSIFYRRSDGMLAEVPFADVDAGVVRWLSPALYFQLCSSNGMAAGNTLEECLVQGLSEVFERYVRIRVLRGEVVCPPIPREELDARGVGELVRRIEQSGRYRVHVLDGSLGRGYPVVVTAIVDRTRASFGVNCGSHPSLAVAVERTLTEAFQGRDAPMFTAINRLAPTPEAASNANRRSVLRNGVGTYPTSLFASEPSWEYERWEPCGTQSNASLLQHMIMLLRRDGFRLLVRDASHLGFPSCHIIVPGMSETCDPTPEGLEAIRVREGLSAALNHFPEVGPKDEEAILEAERRSSSLALVRMQRPFRGVAMQPAAIFSHLHLARGEFAEAILGFEKIAEYSAPPASLFWQAMADYARWRSWGEDRERALRLLDTLYAPAFVRRVERTTQGEDEGLRACYPPMQCYDCDSCAMADSGQCLGRADAQAEQKIAKALAGSTVSQEELLRQLSLVCDTSKEDRPHGGRP